MTDRLSAWSGGVRWGTTTEDAPAYWEPVSSHPTTGKPELTVAIAGEPVLGELVSASWSLGRGDWFAQLQPSNATFSFVGAANANPKDTIVATTVLGPLWSGIVDAVTYSIDHTGQDISTVSATNITGILARAELEDYDIPSGDLVWLAEHLSRIAGVPMQVSEVETDGTLPVLDATTGYSGSVLGYLNRAERSSNALLAVLPNGTFKVIMRAAFPTGTTTVEAYNLVGDNSPSNWDETLALDNVFNAFQLVKSDGTIVLNDQDAASIAQYGLQSFGVDGYLSDSSTHFSEGLKDVVAAPRSILTAASFPVTDLSQHALVIEPLDYVDRNETLWLVTSVQHEVTLSDWRVSITADQSQATIVADETTVPEPDEPTAPPPEGVTYTTHTQTVDADKDATGFWFNLSSKLGAGASPYLPVGYYSGSKFRSFVQFTNLTKPTGYNRVLKATLRLKTSDQEKVAFGSSPKIYVQRINESWSEGTVDGSPYTSGNATVWPGPSVSNWNQATKAISTSQNTWVYIDVTDIVSQWFGNKTNRGFRLKSVNEGSSSRTTEFYSSDHGTAANHPELFVKCEVEE